jgi:hypothetical protein
MVVSSYGLLPTASCASSEVVTRFDGPPGAPGIIPLGGVASAFNSFEGRDGSKGDMARVERVRQSMFFDGNSGQGILTSLQAIMPAANSSSTYPLSNTNIQKRRNHPGHCSDHRAAASFDCCTAADSSPPNPQPDPWCRDGSFRVT